VFPISKRKCREITALFKVGMIVDDVWHGLNSQWRRQTGAVPDSTIGVIW